MSRETLTSTDIETLRNIAHGRLVDPLLVAKRLGVKPMARGNFCRRFRRLYERGHASLVIDGLVVFYRITKQGRSALEAAS